MEKFEFVVWTWIVLAILTFIFLIISRIRAPYGRHTRSGWGGLISNRVGWIIMESPALLVCPVLAILGPREKGIISWILISMWTLHYVNRTLIFPLRIKTSGKKIPLLIVLNAIIFNSINGFINGYYLGYLGPQDEIYMPFMAIGITVFLIGFYINNRADTRLINLRKQTEGYEIPRGWLFNSVSCPNHFGELVEWLGFAIVAWNLPALSFAVWSFANLVPRALNHHEWYHERFPDYPTDRKAVIPYLL